MGKGGASLRTRVDRWRALWDGCVHLAVFVLQSILRLLDGFRIDRVLCLLSVHLFCSDSSVCSKTRWKTRPLLPPRVHVDENALTVVLDLDETLVCAYDSSCLPPGLHSRAVAAGANWFMLQCVAADKEEGKFKVNHITVYERPGLRDFLAKASRFAELVLFTAGLEGYAKPLVDKIDQENRISARLYRPATVVTKHREYVKDLSRLGRDLRRTVIIDNNPCSFILHPLNGIPCVPFTAEDPKDCQLLEVLLPLLELLSTQEDVRPLLSERFQMKAWFLSRGIDCGSK